MERKRGEKSKSLPRGSEGVDNPVSHSDIHNMDPFGVIVTRKPLVSICLRRERTRPSNKPLPSLLSFPAPSQLDSLSPHILCLICQPKPSGPVGRSSSDGSPTSLFSHCISTPADINHGESTPASAGSPSRFRSILVCEKRERRPPTFCSNFRFSAVRRFG